MAPLPRIFHDPTISLSLCAFAVLCGTCVRAAGAVRRCRPQSAEPGPEGAVQPRCACSANRNIRKPPSRSRRWSPTRSTSPARGHRRGAVLLPGRGRAAKKRVGLLVEVRDAGARRGRSTGSARGLAARRRRRSWCDALLDGVDDHTRRSGVEAIYALGTIARPPLAADAAAQLIKALDHYDPADPRCRRPCGRPAAGNSAGDALIKAMNDSNSAVRYAAMRALGDLHEQRAVQALDRPLAFYGKGEGAGAALDALAQIAHPSSVPLFKAHLADKDPLRRRGRGGPRARRRQERSPRAPDRRRQRFLATVRAAMAFALQKVG